jgi:hypothetical protein
MFQAREACWYSAFIASDWYFVCLSGNMPKETWLEFCKKITLNCSGQLDFIEHCRVYISELSLLRFRSYGLLVPSVIAVASPSRSLRPSFE